MIVKNHIVVERLLFCQKCGTWTKHVWNGKEYSCGCGETVLYHAKKLTLDKSIVKA